MKKIIFAVATVAAAALSTPALAQDGAVFSGPTATALIGWDRVVAKDNTGSEGKSGFTYAGALGYDIQANNIVVGAEAEIAGATTKDSFGGLTLKAGRDLYVGGRLGFTAAPNVLVYGKVGYTNAKLKAEVTGGGVTYTASDDMSGYRLGAGVEGSYGKMFARAEYRFSDYGRLTFQNVNTGIDVQRHQVVVGLGYRF